MRALPFLVLFGFTVSFARADQDWGHDFDALIAQPGTQVTYGSINQGDPTRRIRLASGVDYTQVWRNGKVSEVIESDFSNHGAVACAYRIYLAVNAAIAACGAAQIGASDLDPQLARMETFIVANEPARGAVSGKAVAEANISTWKAEAAATVGSPAPEANAAFCQSPQAKFLLSLPLKMDPAKFRDSIDNLLAVPRPAVMNPCL